MEKDTLKKNFRISTFKELALELFWNKEQLLTTWTQTSLSKILLILKSKHQVFLKSMKKNSLKKLKIKIESQAISNELSKWVCGRMTMETDFDLKMS